ncbi:hypothetical protein OTU49_008799, partial [Cherax quadricarinatus]
NIRHGHLASVLSVMIRESSMVSRATWVLIAVSVITMASNTLVPNIPDSVTLENTSLYNLWQHALRYQVDDQNQELRSDAPGPKTILSTNSFKMINLVPMDSPHPLYSNSFIDLRTEFLRDYMISESVSPSDERMQQPEGLSVNNLNGKTLTFKKNSKGDISVEGVPVEDVKKVSDEHYVYSLSDFLFNHEERVREAHQRLLQKQPRIPFGEVPF